MDVSLAARMCQSFCARNADCEGLRIGVERWISGGSALNRLRKWSAPRALAGLVAYLFMALALACSPLPPHPEPAKLDVGFSDEMASAHLMNLASLGPRIPNSKADEMARRYLVREFRLAGADVETLTQGEAHHLVARLSGASQDVILLVAPYSALGSDDWVDLSGAVLLLELARVLAGDPLPYTIMFALGDTRPEPSEVGPDGTARRGAAAAAEPNESERARQLVTEAGESLAVGLESEGGLDRLRAVVVFEPRTGAAPRMARDLRSHPVFRAVFWESAAALGYESSFPVDAGWRSPQGLQIAFQSRGIGQVLTLIDETTARAELRASLDAPSLAGESQAGLAPLGQVTLEALSRLVRRFERVDAFSAQVE